jgi:hypothetical protein
MAAPGVFSLGFKTKEFPAVQANGNIQRGIMAGKLNGAEFHTIIKSAGKEENK